MELKIGKIYVRKMENELDRKVKLTEITTTNYLYGTYLAGLPVDLEGEFGEKFFKKHYKPIKNKVKKLRK